MNKETMFRVLLCHQKTITNIQDQRSELCSLQIIKTDFLASFTKAHKSAPELRNSTDGLILVQLNDQVSYVRNENKATNLKDYKPHRTKPEHRNAAARWTKNIEKQEGNPRSSLDSCGVAEGVKEVG
jgi:hypothetical protein